MELEGQKAKYNFLLGQFGKHEIKLVLMAFLSKILSKLYATQLL